MNESIYPIAVIGGGAAGVMAVLRTVLNNDQCLFFPGNNKYRKRSREFWVRKVENIPGFSKYKKGIIDPNKETLDWIKESNFKDNLVQVDKCSIVEIKQLEDSLFELKDDQERLYKVKYVVLATGIMDIQPEINNSIRPILRYANTQVADYCLRCDGHHTLNKNVTVIGHNAGAAWTSIMLHERYKCPSISIITNGENLQVDKDTKKILDCYSIKIIEEKIIEVLGGENKGELIGYKLGSNQIIDSNFSFISLGFLVYNELAKSLGANLDSRGLVLTDSKGESSISGLFAIGDLRANAKKQIYTSWDHAVDSVDEINARIRRDYRNHCLEG